MLRSTPYQFEHGLRITHIEDGCSRMKSSADEKKKPPEDLEKTIQTYGRELHAFLLRRLRGCGESPEDIRQEIYLRMLRFTDAELIREPRGYLYRVARNVLHDRMLLREREREIFTSATEEQISAHSVEEADEPAAQVETTREIEHILSQLPRVYRTVIVLRKGEGLSYTEIALELDLSVHTVKKYVHLALTHIRSIGIGLQG